MPTCIFEQIIMNATIIAVPVAADLGQAFSGLERCQCVNAIAVGWDFDRTTAGGTTSWTWKTRAKS
jgi:hypothetical protein